MGGTSSRRVRDKKYIQNVNRKTLREDTVGIPRRGVVDSIKICIKNRMLIGFIWLRYIPVICCYEHGN
jgi:hypothetical protein